MTSLTNNRTYTLADYIKRVDLYGPECVLDTARELQHLTPTELKELAGYIQHKERIARWHRGEWVPRPNVARPRACLHCGLDLPVDARANRLQHPHCARTAQTQRHRARLRERAARIPTPAA